VLTGQGWLYVIAVLDVFSRRVVGWAMDTSLDAAMAVRSLAMAIAQRRPRRGLLVHSDRGSQFSPCMACSLR
jgi:putative transposase